MGFGKKGKLDLNYSWVGGGTLGTLANATALAFAGPDDLQEDYRLVKMQWSVAWRQIAADWEGPLIFGICDAQMSIAEIEETLELSGPIARGQIPGTEHGNRPVWILATLMGGNTNTRGTQRSFAEDETTINWTFTSSPTAGASGFKYFVWNLGVGLTTGSSINIFAKLFGVWLT